MFCCCCYYLCSSNSFSNSAAGLTLQIQGRMLRVHLAFEHQMVFLHPGASQAITVPDLVTGTLGFVTRFCSVVQDTLELRSSLAQLPECWDFRCPDLRYYCIGVSSMTGCLPQSTFVLPFKCALVFDLHVYLCQFPWNWCYRQL